MSDTIVCTKIGPIGKPGSATRKRSDTVLDLLITPAAKECGLEPVRADQIADPGSIPDTVIQRLLEDQLVIADLHEHNPNVFYELGIRHTTGKPCILIADTGDTPPFDLHGIRVINLSPKNVRVWEQAKTT